MSLFKPGSAEDQNAVRDLLGLYCRAVDRRDLKLLRSVFHKDAHLDYGEGYFVGALEPFIVHAEKTLATLGATTHFVANSLLRFYDDRAEGETSFVAFHIVNLPQLGFHMTGGRYLDQFERRSGSWGIARRDALTDWDHPSDGFPRKLVGAQNADDPSFHLLSMFNAGNYS